ncbi:MAG: alpha-L-fucosidase [Lachnospiraceae bacterium]|nr:alpha-L-fucosidase [Lachnospiraceae bacterium]
MNGSESEFLKQAARVVPNENQLRWFRLEQYAFIHFGVNTFTGKQWGDGTEKESIFDPKKLDCDQWVRAIKAAGLKGMILTAKHHDGFCLWPSAFTEHSVKNSPCQQDIIREASEACRRGGIAFGFYLSPWDRNSAYYGTSAYNDYYCNQLTELLINYGEIFCVWFDNACTEEGKQIYDFPRYFALVRKYQPQAVIFNDFGPDIRWCGNEAGKARTAEWSVVPTDLCRYAPAQCGRGPMAEKSPLILNNGNEQLGKTEQILHAEGLAYVPAEIDTSIRKDWFWRRHQRPKSLKKLFRIYLNSVGHNACLNLNIPPDRNGLLDERDVKRLLEYGDLLRRTFGKPVPYEIIKQTETEIVMRTECPIREIEFVVLQEDISFGQRVECFEILEGESVIYRGNTIGHKQICPVKRSFIGQLIAKDRAGDRLTVRIIRSRDAALLKDIQLFGRKKASI